MIWKYKKKSSKNKPFIISFMWFYASTRAIFGFRICVDMKSVRIETEKESVWERERSDRVKKTNNIIKLIS